MSLINQMLQDLESRRVGGSELGPLPVQVRLLPRKESRASWLRIAAGFLAAGLLAGGGFLYWQHQQAAAPAAAKSTAGTPQSAAGKLPPAPPAAAVAPAPTPATAPAATEAAASAPAPAVPAEALPLPAAAPATPAVAAAPPVMATPAPPADKPAPAPVLQTAEAPAGQPPATAAASGQPAAQKSAAATRRGDTELKVSTSLTVPKEYLERSTAPAPSAAAAPIAAKPAAQPPRRKAEGPPSIEKQMLGGTAGERAESEYRKAVALLKQGRMSEAFDSLRGALQAEAAHAGARLLLTGLLMEQKRLDEAQVLLKEGLALNPAQAQLAMRLARIQVERGELGGSIETLQRTAPAASDSAEYRGFHAAVLQRLGRHPEAVLEFQSALRLAPQSGIWWMGLGISLEEDHRPAEAREAYQKARSSGTLSTDLEQFVGRKLKQLQ